MHHDGRHSAAASVARLAAETELNAYQDCTFARAIFAHQEVYVLAKWDLLWFVVCGLLVYGVWCVDGSACQEGGKDGGFVRR